jgi:heme A synthase
VNFELFNFFILCIVNKGMSVDDFKFIYWIGYAHRMRGRGLGVMFALPFSYFLRKGYITVRLGAKLCGPFALGAGQGLIGWWMVKSGLEVIKNSTFVLIDCEFVQDCETDEWLCFT